LTPETAISVSTSSSFHIALRQLYPDIEHLVVNDKWAPYGRIYYIYKITNKSCKKIASFLIENFL
jgi:hypothetical protein